MFINNNYLCAFFLKSLTRNIISKVAPSKFTRAHTKLNIQNPIIQPPAFILSNTSICTIKLLIMRTLPNSLYVTEYALVSHQYIGLYKLIVIDQLNLTDSDWQIR